MASGSTAHSDHDASSPRILADQASRLFRPDYRAVLRPVGGHGLGIMGASKKSGKLGAISLLAEILTPILGARSEGIAEQLIERFNSVHCVFAASPDALLRTLDGDEQAVAAILGLRRITAIELRERFSGGRVNIFGKAFLDFLLTELDNPREERLRLVFLDHENNFLRDEDMTSGAKNFIGGSFRTIISRALDLDADKIVAAHNHPSGNVTPSGKDKQFTAELERLCLRIDIELVDHLIVGRGQVFSMRRDNLL